MSRIALAGSVVYDHIMDFSGNFADHFLPDKLHQLSVSFLINDVKRQYGGTAANIAYSLSLFHIPADILATVGVDSENYLARLMTLGVPTDSIAEDPEKLTAGAYIITDKNNNQITTFSPGASARTYEKPVDWTSKEVAVVSPTGTHDMVALARAAKGANVPVFFDPGQQTLALTHDELREGIEGSDALFVNDYELALVLGATGWSEHELTQKVRLLVVTLGKEGSRLVTQNQEVHVPAVVAEAVDPTGAGDAFRAGFLAGGLKALPPETCAKVGSTMAAFAVEAVGGQGHTPSLSELAIRYEAAYGEAWPL